jgi:hypothetical protein
MIKAEELTGAIQARGFEVLIDYETAFMVIVRIRKKDHDFLARVTAQRTAVFNGAERLCQTGGMTWQAALEVALNKTDEFIQSA